MTEQREHFDKCEEVHHLCALRKLDDARKRIAELEGQVDEACRAVVDSFENMEKETRQVAIDRDDALAALSADNEKLVREIKKNATLMASIHREQEWNASLRKRITELEGALREAVHELYSVSNELRTLGVGSGTLDDMGRVESRGRAALAGKERESG